MTGFDVARLAQVSQPTVSRALRNLPGVSAEVRERVERAAAELSYIPSERGRSLSTKATRRIAAVAEELTNPFYPELVAPLRRALVAEGYQMVLLSNPPQESDLIAVLADGSYDGVLLTTTLRGSHLPRDLTELGIPHVLLNRVLDRAESPSWSIDNASGARQVADLLVRLGHRRIAAVNGPVNTSTGMIRARALSARLRQHGVKIPRAWARRCAFHHDSALDVGLQLLDQDERPTAVACGNDVIAAGILSAATVRGCDVPEDLTVVGFDDIAAAAWPCVDLTTVRCDLEALATHAVSDLVALLCGGEVACQTSLIEPTLVLRSTHGPPRGVS